jgi:hypothetical protein
MRLAMLLVASLALGGCVKTVSEMSYPERQQLANEIVKRCEGYGVKYPSPEWDACSKSEAQKEIADRDQTRAGEQRALAAAGAGLSAVGDAYNARAAATPTYTYRPPVTCTTQNLGAGIVHTTCN